MENLVPVALLHVGCHNARPSLHFLLQTVTWNLVNVIDTFYTPLLYVYMFAFYNHQEEDVPRRSTKKK